VLLMRRRSDSDSVFARRMSPFRHRRFRARLGLAGSVTIWLAVLLGVLLVAGVALAGLQSGR